MGKRRFISKMIWWPAFLIIEIACSSQPSTGELNVENSRSALTGSQLAASILGFEDVTLWSATSGAATTGADAVQGSASLALNGQGWLSIQSVPFGPLPQVDEDVSVAVKLPVEQPNPWWYGQVQLYVEVPSLGAYNVYVGAVELTGLPLGEWVTLEFPLPATLQSLLAGSYDDLTITLALNVPYDATGTYLFDDLRFGDDVEPPVIRVATNEDAEYSTGPFETFKTDIVLYGLVEDDIALGTVQVSVDGEAPVFPVLDPDGHFELPLDLTADYSRSSVQHSVEIVATDAAGNDATLLVDIRVLSPSVPNELIAIFNPNTTDADRYEVLEEIQATLMRRLGSLAWLISVPEGTGPDAITQISAPTNRVRALYPNAIMKTQMQPNDSLIEGQLPYLENINAFSGWDIETGSNDVIVAVVDSGVHYGLLIKMDGCNTDTFIDNVYLNHSECCSDPPCQVTDKGNACVPGSTNNPDSTSGLSSFGDCPRVDQNGDGCPGVCGVDDDNDGFADMQDPDVARIYSNGYDDDGDGLIDEQAMIGGIPKNCAELTSEDHVGDFPDYDCDGAANDDDENGYPDDCRGWNFGRLILPDCRLHPELNPEDGVCLYLGDINHPNQPMENYAFQKSSLSGGSHHGSLVAQIIGQPGNDCSAFTGIAHRVRILPLSNSRYFPPGVTDNGEEYPGYILPDLAATIEAYIYAGKAGAHIINSSFTGSTSELEEQYPMLGSTGVQIVTDLIGLSETDAVLHVVGAGNGNDEDGGDDITDEAKFPTHAQVSNMIVVGASDHLDNDARLDFSHYSSQVVDIAAPGHQLISNFSGTSGASPIVAGAAALLMSHFEELRGKPELVAEMILSTARPVDAWTGLSVTGGILDIGAALGATVPEELFEDVSLTSLPGPQSLATNDVDFADVNDDDLLDIFETVCSSTNVVGQPHVRINQSGVFVDMTASMLPSFEGSFCDAAAGDINNDGYIDIVLGAFLPEGTPDQLQNRILVNNAGSGLQLIDGLLPADAQLTRAVELCDFDSDGDLDIYFGNVMTGPETTDVLLRNDGGTFVDVTATNLTVPELSTSVHKVLCADLDMPAANLCQGLDQAPCKLCADPKVSVYGAIAAGDIPVEQESTCYAVRAQVIPELVLVNAEGARTLLLRQDGARVFQDVSCDLNLRNLDETIPDCAGGVRPGRQDHDVETADFNNDGAPDLVMISRRGYRNTLLFNNGAGVFTDVTASNWTTMKNDAREVEVGDVNQDGYQDIVVLRGDPNLMNPGQNTLYLNNGAGHFSEELASGLGTRFAVTTDAELMDIDGDNDPDLLLGRYGEPNQLLENTTVP